MNEEDLKKFNEIYLQRRQETGGTSPPPVVSDGSSGSVTPLAGEAQINDETYKQIVESARHEARKEYDTQEAKLQFAAGAAWAIACFGIAMVALVAWLGYKRVLHPSKLIALGLIVTSALLLIVLGYTDEQMSPVIGLLGTIAGYMLGSKEWDGNDASATSAADDEKTRKRQAESDAAEREAAKRETDTPPQNPDEPVDTET